MSKEFTKNHKYNTRSKLSDKKSSSKTHDKKKKYMYEMSSSSGSDDDFVYSESDISEDDELEEEEEEFNMEDYRNFLAKLYPSKYASNRAKETRRFSKRLRNSDNSDSSSDNSPKQRPKKKLRKNKASDNNIIISNNDPLNENSKNTQAEETPDLLEDAYNNDMPTNNFTIHLTMGNPEEEYSDMSEYEDEDEAEEESDEELETDNEVLENSEENKKTINLFRQMIVDYTEKNTDLDKNDLPPIIQSLKRDLEKKEKAMKDTEKKSIKKIKNNNLKKFITLIKNNKNTSDIKYFKESMDIEKQEETIKKLQEIVEYNNIDKPHKLQLVEANIPIHYKAIAYKKISTLKNVDNSSGEFHKLKQWVDAFMKIPFNKYKHLPVSSSTDDNLVCRDFITKSKRILDDAVYGMNEVKLQIMQMVGQWMANPSAIGNAIAIKGPMGTGKTTLVKEGISKVLNRDFAFITLGGSTDSAFLEGHSYTYEGSMWGQIIDSLIRSKSMNPVFFFDELDKVSDTPKGEEIIGILTHLTDTSQNSKFHDKYFSEIEFDLSKCLFVFSYNDESKVNPILLDRMYKVQTKAYKVEEKINIVNNYLLPKIMEQVGFKDGEVIIKDEIIKYIIEKYTDNESGVRNLKRCIEIIYTKLNLYKFIDPKEKLFDKLMSLEVKFPYEIDKDNISKLIIKNSSDNTWKNMYL